MNLRLWLLLSVFSLPLFVSLDTSSIWDANEAFYVQTPREMVESSNWLVPHFNGEPRLNKPPLAYWLVASLYSLFGVSVFWVRLLTAVCGVAAIVAVFRLGVQLFSTPVAVLGAGIFATTFRFLILSRRALIEILLLALLLWTLVSLFSWLRSRRSAYLYVASILLGLAFLTKGPLVLLLPAVFAVFLGISGRSHLLRKPALLPAILLFLGVAGSWFVALGLIHGWQPVAIFFFEENLGRYAFLSYGPERGLEYYPLVFLGDFFPWSILFLVSLPWWLKKGQPQDARLSMLFLGLWIAAWMVVFSLSHNKQEYYILPVYPAASLWLARYLQQPRYDRLGSVPAGLILFFVSLALPAAMSVLVRPTPLWWLLALPGFSFAAFLARRHFGAAVVSLSLFFFLAFHLLSGPLERFRPVRRLARQIEILEENQEGPFRAGYLKMASPSLAFYLNQPILELFEFDEAAACLSSTTRTYLLLDESDLEALKARAASDTYVAATSPRLSTNFRSFLQALRSDRWRTREAWLKQVVLVSNQPTS